MRRYLFSFAALVLALVVVAPASAKQSVNVTIRHEVKGCHAWSVNGGPFQAAQSLRVKPGAVVTITNTDVMSHQLVQQAGFHVAFKNLAAPANAIGDKGPYKAGDMAKIGAGTRLVLSKPGTYRFTTKGGEDYMKGVKTVGEDNVLELTIVVA